MEKPEFFIYFDRDPITIENTNKSIFKKLFHSEIRDRMGNSLFI